MVVVEDIRKEENVFFRLDVTLLNTPGRWAVVKSAYKNRGLGRETYSFGFLL